MHAGLACWACACSTSCCIMASWSLSRLQISSCGSTRRRGSCYTRCSRQGSCRCRLAAATEVLVLLQIDSMHVLRKCLLAVVALALTWRGVWPSQRTCTAATHPACKLLLVFLTTEPRCALAGGTGQNHLAGQHDLYASFSCWPCLFTLACCRTSPSQPSVLHHAASTPSRPILPAYVLA